MKRKEIQIDKTSELFETNLTRDERIKFINTVLNLRGVEVFSKKYNIEFYFLEKREDIPKHQGYSINKTWMGDLTELTNKKNFEIKFMIRLNLVANNTPHKIMKTISHELAHIVHWNHSEKHNKLTYKILECLYVELIEKLEKLEKVELLK